MNLSVIYGIPLPYCTSDCESDSWKVTLRPSLPYAIRLHSTLPGWEETERGAKDIHPGRKNGWSKQSVSKSFYAYRMSERNSNR